MQHDVRSVGAGTAHKPASAESTQCEIRDTRLADREGERLDHVLFQAAGSRPVTCPSIRDAAESIAPSSLQIYKSRRWCLETDYGKRRIPFFIVLKVTEKNYYIFVTVLTSLISYSPISHWVTLMAPQTSPGPIAKTIT